jgi:hypothetical protein
MSSKTIYSKTVKALYGNRDYYREILYEFDIRGKGSELAFESKGYTSKSHLIYEGVTINRHMFHSDANTYCPECLIERSYWRKNWLLKPNYGCIKHRRLLTHGCNHCGNPLNPLRGLIAQCSNCDRDIRGVPTALADMSAQKKLQDLIANKNQRALDTIFDFFASYSECKTEEISIATAKNSLEFAIAFLEKKKFIANEIAERTVKNHPLMHPRLKLLPFLTSKNVELINLANTVTSIIPSRTYSDRDINDLQLNKKQACAFLAISTTQLETLIRKGNIKWPYSSTGSTEKISAYELIDYLTESEDSHGNTLQKVPTPINSKLLDITRIAERLNVHPEIVRSLIKNHWLPAEKRIIEGHIKTVTSADNLDKFMENYILVGTLAKKINVNPTNLMEKLKKLGIHPIAGRGLDGLITSLFRSDLVSHLKNKDIDEISTYETKTGRPAVRKIKNNILHYTIPKAAKILNISQQKVLRLIKDGILEKHSLVNHRPILIKNNSLKNLITQLKRTDLIPVNEAAIRLGLSENKLLLNWISTGIVDIEKFTFWHFITSKDLNKIKEIQSEYLNATDASLFFGMHRSYIPNLEKRGLISSLKFHGNRSIRLYKISQLQKLKDNVVLPDTL